jgi:hypothetical protein
VRETQREAILHGRLIENVQINVTVNKIASLLADNEHA